jgi:hypothetical protein
MQEFCQPQPGTEHENLWEFQTFAPAQLWLWPNLPKLYGLVHLPALPCSQCWLEAQLSIQVGNCSQINHWPGIPGYLWTTAWPSHRLAWQTWSLSHSGKPSHCWRAWQSQDSVMKISDVLDVKRQGLAGLSQRLRRTQKRRLGRAFSNWLSWVTAV